MELASVGLLPPLLSDIEASVFWRTRDGEETVAVKGLLGSSFVPRGEDVFETLHEFWFSMLEPSTSANGPPGDEETHDVCDLEPLSLSAVRGPDSESPMPLPPMDKVSDESDNFGCDEPLDHASMSPLGASSFDLSKEESVLRYKVQSL